MEIEPKTPPQRAATLNNMPWHTSDSYIIDVGNTYHVQQEVLMFIFVWTLNVKQHSLIQSFCFIFVLFEIAKLNFDFDPNDERVIGTCVMYLNNLIIWKAW